MRALAEYPYLFGNLALVAILLPVLVRLRARELARLALASGLACIPCALLALTHEMEYWSPTRLGGRRIGIEDVVFTFVAGALVWLAAAWPHPGVTASHPLAWKLAAGRMLTWGLASDAVLMVLWRTGTDIMTSTLLAAVPLCAALLFRRPRLWRLAATGVVCFVPLYTAIVRVQFALWPGYAAQWNPRGPWAYLVAGVPAGEIVWAAAFAALWPMAIASAFEVEGSGF